MKKIIISLFFFAFSFTIAAQNVGIGETNPTAMKLQVKSADSAVLLIQNATATGSNVKTGLFFKTGNNYSGSIGTIGSGATFRMGLFTFGGAAPSALLERLSILDGGNVGIGTTNPTARLEVAGSFKVVDGNQAAGKVLTSDANGNATWATPTGGGTFTLPYAGTASTVGGAEFSITHTNTFGDAVYFNNTAGGSSITTGAGNNKLNMISGNTGIGIPSGLSENPSLGKLVVRGSVGATVAVFDDKAAGISLQSNLPSVGFNEYYNAGSKYLSTGYGGKLALSTGTGDLGWYASNTSGVADGAITLNQRLGVSREGSMFVQGTDAGYIFKDRTSTNYSGWNLYANAGKASLFRYTEGGNTITVDSTGALGLQGITTMTAPLTLNNSIGNKIDFYYTNPTSRYGIGLQGGLLQMYSDVATSDIAFGYGSSTAFTEKMRIKGNGNVGIGTPDPPYRLTVRKTGIGISQEDLTGTHAVGFVATSTSGWVQTHTASPLYLGAGNPSNPHMQIETNGNIGIGTVGLPTEKLEVAGQIKITGGSPGSGKVLTSDAAGKGTWLIPAPFNTGFHASATGVVSPNNPPLLVPFVNNGSTQDFDDGSRFFNGPSSFNAGANGVYAIDFAVYCGHAFIGGGIASNGGSITITLRKNGTVIKRITQSVIAGYPIDQTISGSATVKLGFNDALTVYIENDTDIAKDIISGNGAQTYFTGHRIY